MKLKNIDELKNQYIGKSYNKLTIIDVYRLNNRWFVKCRCSCSNECNKLLNHVISGHTKSCGCYKFSEEFSDSLHTYWDNNKEKIKDKSKKFSNWCKNNKDKLAERGKKHSKFYKDNHEILIEQIRKRKETLNNNPEIQQEINNKIKQYWNEERRNNLSEEKKQLYIEHPEIIKKLSDATTKYFRDNPEKKLELSNKIIKYRNEHKDEVEKQVEKHRQWFKDNRQKVLEQSYKLSSIFELKRFEYFNGISSNEFTSLIDAIHPSIRENLLSGKIRVTDNVLTKCPVCSNYSYHIFGNIWRLYSASFRTGNLPMCDKCRYSITASKYEQEIATCISYIHNNKCIKNSREIISPLELDLYYPENKIAIEFNGDYWHSDLFKDKLYHYNKFISCLNCDVLLVNIFECEWKSNKECIISYLDDLFNNKENKLSYIDGNKVNNNYPLPLISGFKYNYNDLVYKTQDNTVFTCGYSTI